MHAAVVHSEQKVDDVVLTVETRIDSPGPRGSVV